MAARVRVSSSALTLSLLTLMGMLAGCNGTSAGTSSSTSTSANNQSTVPAASSSTSQSSSSAPTTASTPSQAVSAALSWTVPAQNTDGSSLTNLAGYRIYYGTDSTAMTNVVQVVGASTTSYTVSNLSPGTYYFAIKAYNVAGTESDLSGVVSGTI